MSKLDKLLSRAGRSSLSKIMSGLRTPVAQLSNKQKATAALSSLAAGAAMGKGIGQPILETLLHSNPEGFLSKAESLAQRSEIMGKVQAASLTSAKEHLAEALKAAGNYNPQSFIEAGTGKAISSAKQEAFSAITKHLDQQAGERLFPRAAELSGILAQARAANVAQDAFKAVPFLGASADISELARNLTILNSLGNPEVVSKITDSYSPIVDKISLNLRNYSDKAIESGFSAKAVLDPTVAKYKSVLGNIKSSPSNTVPEIRTLLAKLRDPQSQVKELLDRRLTKVRPDILEKVIGNASDRASYQIVAADRSLSPGIELLRNNSPGIPVPNALTLDGASALSAAGDAAQSALLGPALEVAGKTTAKAMGKEVPLIGNFFGVGDAISSVGKNLKFDKYISGTLKGPGGNYLVDKSYYTPELGTLYKRLAQDRGVVEGLYNKSLDSEAIQRMAKDVIAKL
jgi:hypothetical protein